MFKLFRKNKKGFTLVEVIVVLVILAILAALMIPAMTGWIDKAKDQSILVEARSVLLAAQTIASEKYATKGTDTLTFGDTSDNHTIAYGDVKTLAGVSGTVSDGAVDDSNGVVTAIKYVNGKTATYATATGWTVSD